MLHLLYGPAASGKTDLLMGRIRAAVAARTPGQVLLVPEQYSHEAERALCAACGDSLSLYAEVLSFTGLARRVAAETGAGDAPLLDQGGRLLCMALALDQVAPRLRLFGAAARRAQMQQTLLGAVDELKTACVTPDALEQTAARCPGYLGDKLHDLALVLAAYDAVTAQSHADPTDRLTHLAERIPESTLGHTGQFYLDGFTDYTRQELAVVRALLTAGADVTRGRQRDLRHGAAYGARAAGHGGRLRRARHRRGLPRPRRRHAAARARAAAVFLHLRAL